jgi:hypothetical protein
MFKIGQRVRIKKSAGTRYCITIPGSEGIVVDTDNYIECGMIDVEFYKIGNQKSDFLTEFDIYIEDLELVKKPKPKIFGIVKFCKKYYR